MDIDLYDDLLLGGDEPATEKEKELSAENETLKKEKADIESKMKILVGVNRRLSENVQTLEKNISSLLKTARSEINRKNESISTLKREMDNLILRRSLATGTKSEYERVFATMKEALQTCGNFTNPLPIPGGQGTSSGDNFYLKTLDSGRVQTVVCGNTSFSMIRHGDDLDPSRTFKVRSGKRKRSETSSEPPAKRPPHAEPPLSDHNSTKTAAASESEASKTSDPTSAEKNASSRDSAEKENDFHVGSRSDDRKHHHHSDRRSQHKGSDERFGQSNDDHDRTRRVSENDRRSHRVNSRETEIDRRPLKSRSREPSPGKRRSPRKNDSDLRRKLDKRDRLKESTRHGESKSSEKDPKSKSSNARSEAREKSDGFDPRSDSHDQRRRRNSSGYGNSKSASETTRHSSHREDRGRHETRREQTYNSRDKHENRKDSYREERSNSRDKHENRKDCYREERSKSRDKHEKRRDSHRRKPRSSSRDRHENRKESLGASSKHGSRSRDELEGRTEIAKTNEMRSREQHIEELPFKSRKYDLTSDRSPRPQLEGLKHDSDTRSTKTVQKSSAEKEDAKRDLDGKASTDELQSRSDTTKNLNEKHESSSRLKRDEIVSEAKKNLEANYKGGSLEEGEISDENEIDKTLTDNIEKSCKTLYTEQTLGPKKKSTYISKLTGEYVEPYSPAYVGPNENVQDLYPVMTDGAKEPTFATADSSVFSNRAEVEDELSQDSFLSSGESASGYRSEESTDLPDLDLANVDTADLESLLQAKIEQMKKLKKKKKFILKMRKTKKTTKTEKKKSLKIRLVIPKSSMQVAEEDGSSFRPIASEVEESGSNTDKTHPMETTTDSTVVESASHNLSYETTPEKPLDVNPAQEVSKKPELPSIQTSEVIPSSNSVEQPTPLTGAGLESQMESEAAVSSSSDIPIVEWKFGKPLYPARQRVVTPRRESESTPGNSPFQLSSPRFRIDTTAGESSPEMSTVQWGGLGSQNLYSDSWAANPFPQNGPAKNPNSVDFASTAGIASILKGELVTSGYISPGSRIIRTPTPTHMKSKLYTEPYSGVTPRRSPRKRVDQTPGSRSQSRSVSNIFSPSTSESESVKQKKLKNQKELFRSEVDSNVDLFGSPLKPDKSTKDKLTKDKSAKDKSAKDKSAKDKSVKDKSAEQNNSERRISPRKTFIDKSTKGNEPKPSPTSDATYKRNLKFSPEAPETTIKTSKISPPTLRATRQTPKKSNPPQSSSKSTQDSTPSSSSSTPSSSSSSRKTAKSSADSVRHKPSDGNSLPSLSSTPVVAASVKGFSRSKESDSGKFSLSFVSPNPKEIVAPSGRQAEDRVATHKSKPSFRESSGTKLNPENQSLSQTSSTTTSAKTSLEQRSSKHLPPKKRSPCLMITSQTLASCQVEESRPATQSKDKSPKSLTNAKPAKKQLSLSSQTLFSTQNRSGQLKTPELTKSNASTPGSQTSVRSALDLSNSSGNSSEGPLRTGAKTLNAKFPDTSNQVHLSKSLAPTPGVSKSVTPQGLTSDSGGNTKSNSTTTKTSKPKKKTRLSFTNSVLASCNPQPDPPKPVSVSTTPKKMKTTTSKFLLTTPTRNLASSLGLDLSSSSSDDDEEEDPSPKPETNRMSTRSPKKRIQLAPSTKENRIEYVKRF